MYTLLWELTDCRIQAVDNGNSASKFPVDLLQVLYSCYLVSREDIKSHLKYEKVIHNLKINLMEGQNL